MARRGQTWAEATVHLAAGYRGYCRWVQSDTRHEET